jgi:hypothetical protein
MRLPDVVHRLSGALRSLTVLKASADGTLGGSEPAVGGSWPALVTLFLVAFFPACASRCNR